MNTDIDALAVVIGRAGSRGLPGKNARPVAGRPMVAHAVADALAARTVGRVVVSTDGDAIAEAGRDAGAEIVRRPAELATDTAPVVAAVRHALETLEVVPKIVVILYANVPVRPADLIDRAVRRLVETNADSVQSYAPVGKHHPYWMVRLDDDERVCPEHDAVIDRRQDLPALFLPDGGVIAVHGAAILGSDPAAPHAFLGADRRGVRTEPGAVVDVDTAADLAVAEAALAARTSREGALA